MSNRGTPETQHGPARPRPGLCPSGVRLTCTRLSNPSEALMEPTMAIHIVDPELEAAVAEYAASLVPPATKAALARAAIRIFVERRLAARDVDRRRVPHRTTLNRPTARVGANGHCAGHGPDSPTRQSSPPATNGTCPDRRGNGHVPLDVTA